MANFRGSKYFPDTAIYSEMDSPVATLLIIATDKGLHALLWGKDRENKNCDDKIKLLKRADAHPVVLKTKQQLAEYFAGKRQTFDIPLVINGTDFQKQAWAQLQKIPYGKTVSYAEQATRVGDKKKARAVGMANGQNPISIIVPCHRVVGSTGKLVGFGGGLDKKALLLALEQS